MKNTPYHLAHQVIQKLTKEFAEMRLEVISSVNVLTEAHAGLFTNIPNDANTLSLTSSSQLNPVLNTLNKTEEAYNLSNNKDNLFYNYKMI